MRHIVTVQWSDLGEDDQKRDDRQALYHTIDYRPYAPWRPVYWFLPSCTSEGEYRSLKLTFNTGFNYCNEPLHMQYRK